jgi:hypothetical protein
MSNALILHTKDNPLIKHLTVLYKRKALKERKTYLSRVDFAQVVFTDLAQQFPDLLKKINSLQSQIRLRTKGVAATESLPALDSVNNEVQLNAAKSFLLKKAYRQAASLAHPDKGGSDDDFNAVKAAYEAGDLDSLNEYVIASHHNLIEQLTHWKNECLKPEAKWRDFVSKDTYKAVQLHQAGNRNAALRIVKRTLELSIVSLMQENSNL